MWIVDKIFVHTREIRWAKPRDYDGGAELDLAYHAEQAWIGINKRCVIQGRFCVEQG